MNAEQWQRVKEVFGEALKVPVLKRPDYISEVCRDSEDVLSEVSKLLSSFDDEYMKESAVVQVAELIEREQLEVGETISHYKIEAHLGSGGMGDVYLADDQQLNRQVAVKVLPPDSAFDLSAGRRLLREARAAAALDHPNICAIYEIGDADGIKFIVMPYLPGETLAHRLERGPLPAAQAVHIAKQVAAALSEAHSHGIVHRDVKPANIIIDGRKNVKVLDFSLAKKFASENSDLTESLFSRPGMIFGTVAYMSPEQTRGNPVDFRSDVWSFGVVLYEMLTGRQPFTGNTPSDTIAAILRSDMPPMDAADLPPELENIVLTALRKDRDARYQTIDELTEDLERIDVTTLHDYGRGHITDEPKPKPITGSRWGFGTAEKSGMSTADHVPGQVTAIAPSWRSASHVAAAAALALIAAVGLWYFAGYLRGDKAPPEEPPAVSQVFSWKRDPGEDLSSSARFSPDGRFVTFASTRNGVSGIWLKQVAGGEAFTRKQDKWTDTSPIFSPDGEQIAFLSDRPNGRGIWTMPAFGGSPRIVASLDVKAEALLVWTDDHRRIIFSTRNSLFSLDMASNQVSEFGGLSLSHLPHASFAISPDGGRIAYTDEKDGQTDIWITSIDGGTPTQVTDDPYPKQGLVWHPDGRRIIYDSVRNGLRQIFIRRLDSDSSDQVLSSAEPLFLSDVSRDGTQLLFYSERDESDLWTVRIDNSQELRLTDGIEFEMWADPAPDGKHLVYQRSTDPTRKINGSSIIVQTLEQERPTRELAKNGFFSTWSPDGSEIAYLRTENGRANLWAMPADGGEARSLTAEGIVFAGYGNLPFNRMQTDYQWSPDGISIVYCSTTDDIPNVWKAAADGTGVVRLTNNMEPGALFFSPAVSPDGESIAFLRLELASKQGLKNNKWSVWVSDRNGLRSVRESEDALGIIGWSASGRELIIHSTPGVGSENMLAATVQLHEISVYAGTSRLLSRITGAYPKNMKLSPDRRSLAYVKRDEAGDSIHVATLAEGNDRTILTSNDERVYFTSLSWAHDGMSLYFGKQANWQVISIMGNLN